LPDLGFGLGLRSEHIWQIAKQGCQDVDWFEIITENYLDTHGAHRRALDYVAEQFPIVMHGVSLSIGSVDPLDFEYLKKVKLLARNIRAEWVSDHLCWTNLGGLNSHDLLPVPLTHEALDHIVYRVHQVQDFLERPLILENPSSYVSYEIDEMTEASFLAMLAQRTGCGILLDVNNVYVSSLNHKFDPYEYIDTLPAHQIVQIHLAGHSYHGTHLVDTHDAPPIAQVWQLYQYAQTHIGHISTLLEWDEKIPPLKVLVRELNKARRARNGCLAEELGLRGLPLRPVGDI